MYKLYLTLENEAGNKIERVVGLGVLMEVENINNIVSDMIDSMETPFDE